MQHSTVPPTPAGPSRFGLRLAPECCRRSTVRHQTRPALRRVKLNFVSSNDGPASVTRVGPMLWARRLRTCIALAPQWPGSRCHREDPSSAERVGLGVKPAPTHRITPAGRSERLAGHGRRGGRQPATRRVPPPLGAASASTSPRAGGGRAGRGCRSRARVFEVQLRREPLALFREVSHDSAAVGVTPVVRRVWPRGKPATPSARAATAGSAWPHRPPFARSGQAPAEHPLGCDAHPASTTLLVPLVLPRRAGLARASGLAPLTRAGAREATW